MLLNMLDRNASGRVELDEFERFVKPESRQSRPIGSYDRPWRDGARKSPSPKSKSKSKSISAETRRMLRAKLRKQGGPPWDMQQALRRLDYDRTGSLDTADFRRGLARCGVDWGYHHASPCALLAGLAGSLMPPASVHSLIRLAA